MTATDRPANEAYLQHLRACQRAALGFRCWSCLALCREADSEDWQRWAKKLDAQRATVGA